MEQVERSSRCRNSAITLCLALSLTACGKQAEDFVRLGLGSGSTQTALAPAAIQSPTWGSTSPTYDLNVSAQWTASTNASSLSIQYYSDAACTTPSGSPITLAGDATSHSFSGSNLTTYSYIVTSYNSSGQSVASACSSSIALDTDACVGVRLTNTPYANGAGTVGSPYLICTAVQMNSIGLTSTDWNKQFKLGADISLAAYTGTQYNLIGTAATKFTGVFNGNNHTISNFTYSDPGATQAAIGLFAYTSLATVKNLTLTNVSILGAGASVKIGAFVGDSTSGNMNNLTMSGTLEQTANAISAQAIGGIAGYVTNTNLSSVTATLTGNATTRTQYFGGILGYGTGAGLNTASTTVTTANGFQASYAGGMVGSGFGMGMNRLSVTANLDISNALATGGIAGALGTFTSLYGSYVTGSVKAAGTNTGGLVGSLDTNFGAGLYESYSTASVTGTAGPTGGAMGIVTGPFTAITHIYVTGAVTSGGSVGGFVGQDNFFGSQRGVYTASFWDSQVNSTLASFGNVPSLPAAVVGVNTAALKDPTTFSGAGWTSANWNLTTSGIFLKAAWQP